MPLTKTQPVTFKTNSNEISTHANLVITVYDDKDRVKRALKRLGLFWLLSVGSIPIIFAHWVLVPGFFIAGPIAAMMVYRTSQSMDHASGQCPHCNEHITIKLEAKDTLPKWTYCSSCNHPLQIDYT
ncbi:MAG: DUF2096 domain-containing protein [Gammaproteobacteria bacterium]|nr:DUF2096 domain-containing protein [Gammaproteobacteria bacterium]